MSRVTDLSAVTLRHVVLHSSSVTCVHYHALWSDGSTYRQITYTLLAVAEVGVTYLIGLLASILAARAKGCFNLEQSLAKPPANVREGSN